MENGIDLDESNEDGHQEQDKWNGLMHYIGQNRQNKGNGLVDSNEIHHFVEALEQKDALQHNLEKGVTVELVPHFHDIKERKEHELRSVHDVPHVSEVSQSLFLQLNQLKHEEEYLGKQARCVCDIQDQFPVRLH
tara:strand:+ start:1059 stop:1463 length:405 start_codon:yes stop_codon:yes gene_type:complete